MKKFKFWVVEYTNGKRDKYQTKEEAIKQAEKVGYNNIICLYLER